MCNVSECSFNNISILKKCLKTVCCESESLGKNTLEIKNEKTLTLFCIFYFHPVALNFQTAGEGMDLNDGLFSQNGRSGYILKPSFMRDADQKFDPETPQKQDGHQPCILTIQVQNTLGGKKCIPEVVYFLFQSF